MLLNGDEIKRRGLVANSDPKMFKAASYNPRIGKILTSKGEELTTYVLPPLGTVEVVSTEEFNLPENVAGYATVKTSLCNDGVLAINIGIIDPRWKGSVSSTLINFGKHEYLLQAGAEFLRLTFHEYHPQAIVPRPSAQILSHQEYVAEKKQKVLQHLSETFLNLEENTRRITQVVASDVLNEWRQGFFKWIPVAAFSIAGLALVLAILTFLLNFGNAWVVSTRTQDTLRSEMNGRIETEAKKNEEFRRIMEQQMQDVTKQLQTKQTVQPPKASPKP